MSDIRTVLFFGKPGSGKGTQGKLLSERFKWSYSATGDRFRKEAESDTEVGRRIKAALATGAFLPSSFIDSFLLKSLQNLPQSHGLVLDGYGRTLPQANNLHEMLEFFERPYRVVELELSDELVIKRMKARSTGENRSDSDTEDKIRRRLQDYRRHTEKVTSTSPFRERLIRVETDHPVEEVHEEIVRKLGL